MKSALSPNHDCTKGTRITLVLVLAFLLVPFVCEGRTAEAEKVLGYLKGLGNGRYMFGQMGMWVHDENPDMDGSGGLLGADEVRDENSPGGGGSVYCGREDFSEGFSCVFSFGCCSEPFFSLFSR